jgi:hypothetical protein
MIVEGAMRSTLVNSAAFVLAAFFAVSVTVWDQDPMRDGPSDSLITPWCRIGSLDSWEGRPCVVPYSAGQRHDRRP